MGFIEWVKELFNSEKKPKPKTKEELQAEENARIKLELEILKKQMKDNDSRYGALIENAKKQEISTTLQLNDLDSKTRNRITESYIGMEKKIEKLQGENDLFKIKDLERDKKDFEKDNEIKDLKAGKTETDNEIKALKADRENQNKFIITSLEEMKNVASLAKDSIHTANFFKTKLLKIIDKQVEMNDEFFQHNKQSCGKKITQYTTKKAEVSDMKFKLGTEIDSLTKLINNRINVQANKIKRNNLETQITECNDALISYTNLLSKTKSDWDTFESNNRTENDELNALKEEVINRNIATIEEVDEIINRVETLHKATFSLPDNDIVLNSSTKKQTIAVN